jgi:integrase
MSIFKKNGSWFVRYRNIEGKQKQVKAGAIKALATELERKILAERDIQKRFGYKQKKEITFSEFIPEYFQRVSSLLSKNTIKNKICILNNMSEIFGNKLLSEIDEEDFYKFINTKKLNTSSIKTYKIILKAVITEANEAGYNVADLKIKIAKKNIIRVRYLTEEEAERLIHNSGKLRLLVIMALSTGMRKMEMLNLTWQNIDFTAKLIHIEESKNGERRSIPISDSLLKELQKQENKEPTEKIFKIKYLDSFLTVLKKSNIKNFHFHDLRHTFASWLAMKGVSLYTIKELLGHKSILMTQRYAHLSPDSRFAAVNLIKFC